MPFQASETSFDLFEVNHPLKCTLETFLNGTVILSQTLNADPRIGSAYKLATQACVALADKWMESQQHAGPMSLVLEDGCKYSKDFLDQLENLERPLGTL